MARLTELQDGSDSDDARPFTSSRPGLTQDEQEQILHKSGLIEKLGLPKDFVTMEEAQAQLNALNDRSNKASSSNIASSEPKHRVENDGDKGSYDSDYDSEDDYGIASNHEVDVDDTANRLMEEQEATEMSAGVESILDLVIWTMPFGFMYTLLDILVRQQYGETVGLADELGRLARALPVLAFFIHYNLTSPRQALIQGMLFVLCSACGCGLIYIVNKSPYDIVVQRVAPLGTLWIFSVVRMDLLPACISLAIVAFFVQQSELKIVFD
ncbi:uncharacterized protein MEPE_01794 [Melanopsichium pennsylvanicum]|uniref:DUF7719 domain-containing protein n=2 Tax=Melanopsichium pennsylvanicum TaxID=63383 RepID=A0AAJ4XJ52_9BASI|nr:conserved hypothetical protein [Melanopsichium pennsylvanicum 4]SNX83088.1 uncharacterized protein MEPE_01794 [Melanopsichium pennsylvanicum]